MIPRKTCTACGKRQSATAFNGSARAPDGLAQTCRACTNTRRRERDRAVGKRPKSHTPSTVLATALRRGDIETVRTLLAGGMTPSWSWICETMREGHLALAEALLGSGVERNIFTMAAMGELKALTRRLGRVRADARRADAMEPASDRVTPLHVGCASDCWSSGNLELVRWLLRHGAVATEGHLAAALGHLQRHGRGAYDVAEAQRQSASCGVDRETGSCKEPLICPICRSTGASGGGTVMGPEHATLQPMKKALYKNRAHVRQYAC